MDESLINIRHERSKKDFPALKLDEGEYVEFVFSRAPVCYWAIWGAVGVAAGIIIAVYLLFAFKIGIDEMGQNFMRMMLVTLLVILGAIGAVATKVFNCNKLYITNKRAIQYIMLSPMATSKNAIALSNIEDVSFRQDSLLQKLFKIGTLRLSTVGEETTYTVPFAENPGDTLNEIMRLIRADKKSTSDEDFDEDTAPKAESKTKA